MRQITLADRTMRELDRGENARLSFREKLELAKLLDKLGVPVLELSLRDGGAADALLIKSVCSVVKNATVAVNVGLDASDAATLFAAMTEAKHPRLQVSAPVSAVQMEYISGRKPTAMIELLRQSLRECRALCGEVELIAEDATRAEPEFLRELLIMAVEEGAAVVTLCDSAGAMLPDELAAFLRGVCEAVPQLSGLRLGVCCSNELAMADSCAVAAIGCGVSEVKCVSFGSAVTQLSTIARVLEVKGEELDAECALRRGSLHLILGQIAALCRSGICAEDNKTTAEDDSSALYLTERDDMPTVLRILSKLGYEIPEEDSESVYEAFLSIARRKEQVGARELEAIISAATLQVPPTYKLESYVINTGNTINATAHLRLSRDGTVRDGIGLGDGPIDAAFLAIEQIMGHHYELDDFQISAVTEGREAMGQAVVRLRSGSRLCTGVGISTDIIGASIRAYLSALNRIAYEEGVQ